MDVECFQKMLVTSFGKAMKHLGQAPILRLQNSVTMATANTIKG